MNTYLNFSKLNGAGRKGWAGAAVHWDYLAAFHGSSLFWTFIDEPCYYDKYCMADYLKVAMAAVNVYHFFIRKGCFMQCIHNLIHFNKINWF